MNNLQMAENHAMASKSQRALAPQGVKPSPTTVPANHCECGQSEEIDTALPEAVGFEPGTAKVLVQTPAEVDDEREHQFFLLLQAARSGEVEALGTLLQWYANYLTILARTQLDRRLRRRMNPSDVVQEAMLAAHKDFAAFRGHSQGELLSWLRTILVHTLHRSFAANIKVGKRDIRKERSIDELSDQVNLSAHRLANFLPANSPSPSASLQAHERDLEFANQLSRLKPDYREVILLRVIQGLSFEEISQQMDRSCGAVRMLWLRALEAFKTHSE